MAHQLVSLKHDESTPDVFDMSDPGTGKTAVRIWAFAERRRKQRTGPMVVFAPRSLLVNAWANDCARFAPDMKVSVAWAKNREEAFAADADIYITNHDAAKWFATRPREFYERFRDGQLVLDESTAYKHHTSQRSRAVQKLSLMKTAGKRNFSRRAALSATPISNGICDIWHQVYVLDAGHRLGTSFYAFRNEVSIPKQVGRNVNAIQWADKPGAEEAVFGLLADITVRHRIDDCTDIPETHLYTISYQLSAKQWRAYKEMETAQLLMLKGGKMTAVNAAAVSTKLLQIASGAVYDNDHAYHVIDRDRYELILDLAEARKHPIVFFFWTHQMKLLTEEATKRGLSFVVIDGEVSDKEMSSIVRNYQAGTYDVLFAHPKSAAHGLTLTRGTSIIWSAPTANLEWFIQGNRRQARLGQKEKTEVIVVLGAGTYDERVYHEILMPKDGRQRTLLELFADETKG